MLHKRWKARRQIWICFRSTLEEGKLRQKESATLSHTHCPQSSSEPHLWEHLYANKFVHSHSVLLPEQWSFPWQPLEAGAGNRKGTQGRKTVLFRFRPVWTSPIQLRTITLGLVAVVIQISCASHKCRQMMKRVNQTIRSITCPCSKPSQVLVLTMQPTFTNIYFHFKWDLLFH